MFKTLSFLFLKTKKKKIKFDDQMCFSIFFIMENINFFFENSYQTCPNLFLMIFEGFVRVIFNKFSMFINDTMLCIDYYYYFLNSNLYA